MPTEQRVIANKPKIGAKPTIGGAAAVAAPESTAAPAKSRKKLVLVLAALLVVGGGAGWYFLMGPGAATEGEAAVEPAPEPGAVLDVEAISINLADGHYLRLGMGLQLTADAGGHGDPTAAPALDHAIALFSGRPMAEVASPEGREALKAELVHRLEEAYHGDVMDVYFTEYVTQ